MQASESSTGKKKVRGAYYGAAIEKEIAMKRGTGVTHLEVLFNPTSGKAIDKYGKWFNNFTAHLVRENASPEYFFWKDVPPTTVEVIYQKLSEKFHFPHDDAIIKDSMDRNMQRYYSEWLYGMKQHWSMVGGETNTEAAKAHPYNNVHPTIWLKLCDHWSSESQQAISQRNKANRAKLTMLGGHGSKSIVAHISEIAKSGQPPSTIDTFEKLHRKQDGWLSEEAEKAHQEMVRRRASESSRVVTSDQGDATEFPADMDIVSDVLGSRSRHKKGFGSLPRLKAFGGKRARTSTSSSGTQQQQDIDRIVKEHRQLREYTTAQHQFSMEQMQEMNEMKKLFQQMQDLVPGLTVPQHLVSTVRVPPPPPVIFDDPDTTQPSMSAQEEDDEVENLD